MSILKCKMCGGDLEISEGITVCECEYCGTKQTVPSADDEKKMTLFGRANRLRFGCEFDKASGVYESIVADFPEEAEAYWGLVLCKYGIEYVDDPATAKKIPTCHRSSFESVMDDSNFEQVMENADTVARGVYREEAKQIEELRKGIIEVSSKEEPYDIFICYKETDENGDRTVDSVIAQDVYDALTEKGYKVFFSRITLEDKLGQEYEPYIFAALNSAKVMLAFGTSYDNYNAVWVKNEWSRFLQLIAKGEKKTLIPCYKNIDAYDMPKEFAKLQAQDMGKVGAVQDLLRGIEKILENPKDKTYNTDSAVDTLLQQGYNLLKQQQFTNANSYFTKVIERSPKTASAYWGKMLCKQQCIDSLDLCGKTKVDQFAQLYFNSNNELDCNKEKLKNVILAQLDPEYTDAVTNASGGEKNEYIATFEKICQSTIPVAESLFDERKKKVEAQQLAEKKELKKEKSKNKKYYFVFFLVNFLWITGEIIFTEWDDFYFIPTFILTVLTIIFSLICIKFIRGDGFISVFIMLTLSASCAIGAGISSNSAVLLLFAIGVGLFDFIYIFFCPRKSNNI